LKSHQCACPVSGQQAAARSNPCPLRGAGAADPSTDRHEGLGGEAVAAAAGDDRAGVRGDVGIARGAHPTFGQFPRQGRSEAMEVAPGAVHR